MVASTDWFTVASLAIAALIEYGCMASIEYGVGLESPVARIWQRLVMTLFGLTLFAIAAFCGYVCRTSGPNASSLALFLIGAVALYLSLVCLVTFAAAAGNGLHRTADVAAFWLHLGYVIMVGPTNWISFAVAAFITCPMLAAAHWRDPPRRAMGCE